MIKQVPLKVDATRHAWRLACVSSTTCDNMITVDRTVYVIDKPEQLQNGAVRGRIFRQGATGFVDHGGYKIAANGDVEQLPEELKDVLPMSAPITESKPRDDSWDDAAGRPHQWSSGLDDSDHEVAIYCTVCGAPENSEEPCPGA